VLSDWRLWRRGKVCDVYENDGGTSVLLTYTDRASCDNKPVGTIAGKGLQLARQSAFWHERCPVPTHFIRRVGSSIVAHKCKPIPLEVIVRGHLLGSLEAKREWPGIDATLFEGMKRGDKFRTPILTPTRKSDADEPISGEEIVESRILTQQDWDTVSKYALEMFAWGVKLLERHGVTLADAKFEFGFRCDTEEICVMDEVFTCDTARGCDVSLI